MGSLQLNDISKKFGSVEVLNGIDLEVADGEFVIFVGPSGCGKSTLLRTIAGLEDATGGTIRIDGEVVNGKPPTDRGIAMVFQTYALYPHLSVRDNMSLGLKQAKTPKDEIVQRVDLATRMLSLEDYLERRPVELSARLCASQNCFCLMSRYPIWMRRCGFIHGWKLPGCTGNWGRPWSM